MQKIVRKSEKSTKKCKKCQKSATCAKSAKKCNKCKKCKTCKKMKKHKRTQKAQRSTNKSTNNAQEAQKAQRSGQGKHGRVQCLENLGHVDVGPLGLEVGPLGGGDHMYKYEAGTFTYHLTCVFCFSTRALELRFTRNSKPHNLLNPNPSTLIPKP